MTVKNDEITVEIEDGRMTLNGPVIELGGRDREFLTWVNSETFKVSGMMLIDDSGGFGIDSEFTADYPEVRPHIRRIETFVKGMQAVSKTL